MDITELLAFSVKNNASDLHLSAGLPPIIRVDGEMRKLNVPALDHKQVHGLVYEIMNDMQRKEYEENLETDFSFEVNGLSRFRVNAFVQNRGAAAVLRTIPSKVLTLDDLGAPEIFKEIINQPTGIVLVTGATGSGKSTTLAAMVDHISQGRLRFGVGRSSFIESYQGYNVDYAESRSLFFESLEVIQKAWTESPFSYHGEHYDYENVNLVPKPLQSPHPPIRVAVESRETFGLIGSLGFPIFIRHQMEVPELKALLAHYKVERELAGFSGPNDVILQLSAYVADTAEKARTVPEASTMRGRRMTAQNLAHAADQETYDRLMRISETTYEDVLNRVVYGTPEAVADRIREYQEELGITGVSLDMNPGGQLSKEQVVASIKLLADKVVPGFK